MSTKTCLLAVYDCEDKVLAATRLVREKGLAIHDVFTPYAVHGMDEAMGLRRSRLPIVTFVAGLFGLILAFWFQSWSSAVSWPLNVGGKPFLSFPAWIPVAFEITILIGGLSTVAALFIRSKIGPGKKLNLVDPRVTDDRFVIAIDQTAGLLALDEVKKMLISSGALEIKESGV